MSLSGVDWHEEVPRSDTDVNLPDIRCCLPSTNYQKNNLAKQQLTPLDSLSSSEMLDVDLFLKNVQVIKPLFKIQDSVYFRTVYNLKVSAENKRVLHVYHGVVNKAIPYTKRTT